MNLFKLVGYTLQLIAIFTGFLQILAFGFGAKIVEYNSWKDFTRDLKKFKISLIGSYRKLKDEVLAMYVARIIKNN